ETGSGHGAAQEPEPRERSSCSLHRDLSCKAAFVCIQVSSTEKSDTSKACFLDGDALPVYDTQRQEQLTLSRRRIKPGLYRAADGRHINAEVNGAYNFMRTIASGAFAHLCGRRSGWCVVHAVRLAA